MKRLCTETSGIESWRERLADPETQWVRECSAMEAAVSWELAGRTQSGLPGPISKVLDQAGYRESRLLIGVAERRVPLDGKGHDSQCDLWALLGSSLGFVSLSVEAKANEPFGTNHQNLENWLDERDSTSSKSNRLKRWNHVERMLPATKGSGYGDVAFQLLHRCATAVIEAERLGINHAIFIVQAFQSPESSYSEFRKFCEAIGIASGKGVLHQSHVGEIALGIAWLDFPFATDAQLVKLIPKPKHP